MHVREPPPVPADGSWLGAVAEALYGTDGGDAWRRAVGGAVAAHGFPAVEVNLLHRLLSVEPKRYLMWSVTVTERGGGP